MVIDNHMLLINDITTLGTLKVFKKKTLTLIYLRNPTHNFNENYSCLGLCFANAELRGNTVIKPNVSVTNKLH